MTTPADRKRPPLDLQSSQAGRVFDRFGGSPRRLWEALRRLGPDHERDLSGLYKWLKPKLRGGTGGIVPTAAWPSIQLAAQNEGVLLRPEDISPITKGA